MTWEPEPEGYWEYVTVGPFKFAHQRDTACNALCAGDGRWHMHSSDVHRRSGDYFAIMCRWVKRAEIA